MSPIDGRSGFFVSPVEEASLHGQHAMKPLVKVEVLMFEDFLCSQVSLVAVASLVR